MSFSSLFWFYSHKFPDLVTSKAAYFSKTMLNARCPELSKGRTKLAMNVFECFEAKQADILSGIPCILLKISQMNLKKTNLISNLNRVYNYYTWLDLQLLQCEQQAAFLYDFFFHTSVPATSFSKRDTLFSLLDSLHLCMLEVLKLNICVKCFKEVSGVLTAATCALLQAKG